VQAYITRPTLSRKVPSTLHTGVDVEFDFDASVDET